jgi:BASS family bile acid:Na+ symporter
MSTAELPGLLGALFLLAMMAATGVKVRFADLLDSLQNRRLIIMGLLANFGLVPLTTFALLQLFPSPPLLGAGFLILAASPGAPVALLAVNISGGNLSLGVALVVILSLLVSALTPALLRLLLVGVLGAEGLQVNYVGTLAMLLLTQLLPLASALSFRAWKPVLASRLVKPLNMLSQALLVVLLLGTILVQWRDMLAFGPMPLAETVFLIAVTLAIGWWLGGPKTETRKTLAITTANRNLGVGLIIATQNFAGTATGACVAVYGVVGILVTLGLALVVGKMTPPSSR